MTNAKRQAALAEQLDGLDPVFGPLSDSVEWASRVLTDVEAQHVHPVIRVVAGAVMAASSEDVAQHIDALRDLDKRYGALVGDRERSLIWALSERHPSDEVLVELGVLEVSKRWWKGAVEAFERVRELPADAVSPYCAALIHCGRPDDVRSLIERHGTDVERGEDWYRIATSTQPAKSPTCGCADFEGAELPPHPALKDVLWFSDDCYDDDWAFCLDCHQLWNGGTEGGDRVAWRRVDSPSALDHEGMWTCGFGANAHPGSDILQDHDRFVRWVVELKEPEQAFSLP